MSKKKILKDFLEKFQHLPEQKSDEWHKQRLTSIGGSEIATVIGLNKYQKKDKLVAQKVGLLPPFTGNAATYWGSLMEDVTTLIVKKLFHVKYNIELGSLPGVIESQRFSPDGLAVCKINGKEYIILFEFKSPFRAILPGYIPAHYKPQILTGLDTIKIADYGIFVNNIYCFCSYPQYYFNNEYNKNFHERNIDSLPIAMGMIGVYCDNITWEMYNWEDKYYDDYELDALNDDLNFKNLKNNHKRYECFKITTKLFDMGGFNKKNLTDVLKLISEGVLKTIIYKPQIFNSQLKRIKYFENDEFKQDDIQEKLGKINKRRNIIKKCKKMNTKPIGYLCYKLFDSEIIKVDRIEKYVDNNKIHINHTVESIDKILKSTNKFEKFKELFPNSKILDKIKESQPDKNILKEYAEYGDFE